MASTSESKEWRKMVDPAIKGLVALMAAAALYLNSNNNDTCDIRYSNLDKRISLAEQNISNLQVSQDALSSKLDKILDAVTFIQIDIAKISTVVDNTKVKR